MNKKRDIYAWAAWPVHQNYGNSLPPAFFSHSRPIHLCIRDEKHYNQKPNYSYGNERNTIEAQGGSEQATILFRQQINENDNNKQNEIDVMISARSYNFFPAVMNFIVFQSVVSFLLQFKWTRQGC